MKNRSKKASVFRRISKKRLCIAVLIAAIAAAVAAVLLLSDSAARAVAVSLCLVCVMLTLPALFRAKPKRKKSQKRDPHLDAHRLMPQDKGKIIPFPGNKKRP